jgi:hypothetical protein
MTKQIEEFDYEESLEEFGFERKIWFHAIEEIWGFVLEFKRV